MNALARALETSQPHRFTLDDVLRMQDAGILDADARVELIDGGLVEMASEGAAHTRAKMQIAYAFMAQARGEIVVIIDSTLRLAPTYAPDPDLYLYDASLSLEQVSGANLGLVVEVAQSTVGKDLSIKAELYAQHGVRDYWVVDVNTSTITVHRGPSGGGYGTITQYSAHDTVASLVFPALTLCLADLPPIR
ncbi:MAG TPA: Uma2 family endonuclease [Caulobacter sp.]|nr:Uma2 family endonuclease [Caulobacter sp.]